MIRERTIAVRSPRSFHRGRARTKVLKHGRFPVLVNDTITLENHPTLKLALGMIRRKLIVFLTHIANK
eukprot:5198396-Heterocapsa_arctica.AAC.1